MTGQPVILAIDPGPIESGWIVYNAATAGIRAFAKSPNEQLLANLRNLSPEIDAVVIEQITGYNVAAGAELFETIYWSGIFAEAARPTRVDRISRKAIVGHLCGSARAKDSDVHAALIDRFGGVGGKAAAVGLKASPGPLYGVKRDVWSALAVAVVWADREAGS